jgi:hypothetical protein
MASIHSVSFAWSRYLLRLCSLLFLPGCLLGANVNVNMDNRLSIVSDAAFGIHSSVYDNQNANAALPGLLKEAGITALRYSGGGYADVYHWSVHKLTPWFNSGSYGYLGPSTDFGHFTQLIGNANAQAVITVNYGSSQKWDLAHTQLVSSNGGQSQEAAAWVAYANGDAALYGTTNDIPIGVDADGNDWRTAGFWAKLRSSTLAQYQAWAGIGTYNSDFNFLAINHPLPLAIKYWEIGNETFGSAYYDQQDTTVSGSTGYSENLFAPFNVDRRGSPSLSPAFYGQKVNEFAAAMKAVDPTIKIGAVLTTPPDDYSWDYYQRYNASSPYSQINNASSPNVKHWNAEVLAQCASNVDFVIAHWYPYAGNNADGTSLLSQVRTKLPQMINGTTSGLNTGVNAGLRDLIKTYRPVDGTNVEIFITEFGYNGSLGSSVLGPSSALFVADSYATWLDLGVANVDYLEMNKTAFLGDGGTLVRGSAFYGVKTLRTLAGVGDSMVMATSDQVALRAHATLRQDGKIGVLLINTDPANSQTANVTVAGVSLAVSGVQYQFGTDNFPPNNEIPSSGISSNNISGLGNSFSVEVPAYTMIALAIPTLSNTAPVFPGLSNQIVNVGQAVALTASATDTDSPAQSLTFTLLNAPTNATLNPTSGAFEWRPPVSQADTTNFISLKVADNGSPPMSATQSFVVAVNPLPQPSVTAATLSGVQFTLQVNGQSGPDYAVQVSSNLLVWSTVFITNSPPMPFQWTDMNSPSSVQFYRIKAGPPLP